MPSEDWKVIWSLLVWLWPRVSLYPWTSDFQICRASRSSSNTAGYHSASPLCNLEGITSSDWLLQAVISQTLVSYLNRILHSWEFQNDSDSLSVKTFPIYLLAPHEYSFKHKMLRFPLVTQHGTRACRIPWPQLDYALKKSGE